ncbi:MAG: 30S ribosomal protein S4 [Rhodospirillaceae bacterium]|nr:30S ribosomal protein S4 [Rhodospirillaceae bacterium]
MTKRIQSKYKIDRRLGVNLWGSSKSPLNSREYGPGQHGQQRRKPTGYGVQLLAKQRLKGYYGNIGERQFRRVYQEAVRRRGDNDQNLVGLLESRLESLVYRAKFAPTVFAARQLVNHGHVLVNGKSVNIGSAKLKEGDVLEVREKSKEMILVMESVASNQRDVPDYLELDSKGMRATFKRVPLLEDVPYPVQMQPKLVIEFYSR